MNKVPWEGHFNQGKRKFMESAAENNRQFWQQSW